MLLRQTKKLWAVLVLAAVLPHVAAANSSATAALQKQVIVVVGSTGSNVVQAVLEAAGVWMHPDTDAALNARVYAQKILMPMTLGLPANHTCFNQSSPNWSKHKAAENMFQRVVPSNLVGNITEWHKEMAQDMAAAVPASATTWGWKHPYALFTLNHIYQAFPNVHVIQQVQDGRDYALNNLLRHKKRTTNTFEQHFVQLLTGGNFTEAEKGTLRYSAAVGQAWALANHRALKWSGERATAVRGTHSIVRIEDLCSHSRAPTAVRTMLRNAQLPHSETVVQQAVVRLKNSRCHVGYWRVALNSSRPRIAAALRQLDADISAGLEAFDYVPDSPLGLPPWLHAQSTMTQLTAAARAAAGSSNHPVILTFVSNGYERVISNWLAWLQDSSVDTSHVLIVARKSCYRAVRNVTAGTTAIVFKMPPLSPNGAAELDEKGRRADLFKNVRSGIWLERVRTLYELNQQGLQVILTDLDAIWTKTPVPYIMAAARGQAQGFDLIVSKGYFPSEVFKNFKVAACMGFVYLNATQPAQFFIRSLLREKLRHLELDVVRYYNDQQHMNQALVDADLAYNVTLQAKQFAQQPATIITAHKLTTADTALHVLFMPESMVQRSCENNTVNSEALVVHCQSPKTGREKEAYLQQLQLWKQLPAQSLATVH